MKSTYYVSLEDSQLILDVIIDTSGIVYTKANQFLLDGGNLNIGESNDNTGCLNNIVIDLNKKNKNSYIIISSIIDFSTYNLKTQDHTSNNFQIRYYISGGKSGEQCYYPDLDDITELPFSKNIIESKLIELV